MKTPETKSAAWLAQESRIMRRHDPVVPARGLNRPGSFFSEQQSAAPLDAGYGSQPNVYEKEKSGVDNVHTPGFGLGRTGVGSCRIPHVSAGA